MLHRNTALEGPHGISSSLCVFYFDRGRRFWRADIVIADGKPDRILDRMSFLLAMVCTEQVSVRQQTVVVGPALDPLS